MVQKETGLGVFFEDAGLEVSKSAFSDILGCSRTKVRRIVRDFVELGYVQISQHGKYSFYKLNKDNLDVKNLAAIYWRDKLKVLTEKINVAYKATGIVMVGDVPRCVNDRKDAIKLVVFSNDGGSLVLTSFVKALGRGVQIIRIKALYYLPKSYVGEVMEGIRLS